MKSLPHPGSCGVGVVLRQVNVLVELGKTTGLVGILQKSKAHPKAKFNEKEEQVRIQAQNTPETRFTGDVNYISRYTCPSNTRAYMKWIHRSHMRYFEYFYKHFHENL